MGAGIKYAEIGLHPDAPKDFIPSHAGIVSFNDQVVEAWLSLTEDSVAAINPASKYQGLDDFLEIWRPSAFEPEALGNYVRDYGPEKYGWLNLLGFEYEAIIKEITGKDVANPLECSHVCSQGALIYLGKYLAPMISPQEHWAYLAASDDLLLRDCDPLELRMMLLAHQ
jgi:hypothetical protein